MKPWNRRLLIDIIAEEPEQGAFFVPTEEKSQEFLRARVISCATDCSQDLTNFNVVFHAFGKEEVTIKGHKYIFIGENHLICIEEK